MSKHDSKYMAIAELMASFSHAEKRKVGAVIVKNNNIISDGYNGTPPGFSNTCEIDYMTPHGYVLKTKPEVIHAEANAILKTARGTQSCEGATIYITIPPCIQCAAMIAAAGIVRVVYKQDHKQDGLDLLKKAKIRVNKL